MTQWVYRVLDVAALTDVEDLQGQLQELGDFGWELASSMLYTDGSGALFERHVFKRLKGKGAAKRRGDAAGFLGVE